MFVTIFSHHTLIISVSLVGSSRCLKSYTGSHLLSATEVPKQGYDILQGEHQKQHITSWYRAQKKPAWKLFSTHVTAAALNKTQRIYFPLIMVLLEMSDDDRTRRQRSICETNGANGILFPSPAKTLTRLVIISFLTWSNKNCSMGLCGVCSRCEQATFTLPVVDRCTKSIRTQIHVVL